MHQILDIGKRSLETLWSNKYLWFFGFFVATAGNGSGGSGPGGGAAPAAAGPQAWPGWVWPLLALAVVAGLLYFALHILSEAALIEGVAEGQQGQRLGIRNGLRRSRRHFWRIIALKLLFGLVGGLSAALVAAPLLLAHLAVAPLWLAVILTVLLALVGLPWLLTLYFLYEYALRFAVLEDRRTGDAVGRSRRFLHGRLGLSIKLTLLSLVGQMGGSMAIGLAMLPAAVLAGIGYLIGGVPWAIGLGSMLGLPVVALGLGALGTFRSSVWTLGFIDHHFGPPAGSAAGLPAGPPAGSAAGSVAGSPPAPAGATLRGAVATREGSVATREGAVATREGAVATREGAVATREGAVATREGAVATREDAGSASAAAARPATVSV
jgi:hypothetical protein